MVRLLTWKLNNFVSILCWDFRVKRVSILPSFKGFRLQVDCSPHAVVVISNLVCFWLIVHQARSRPLVGAPSLPS